MRDTHRHCVCPCRLLQKSRSHRENLQYQSKHEKQAERKYLTNFIYSHIFYLFFGFDYSSVCCLTSQDRPAEKPICICISSVEQLVAAKPPFSPLLWDFMKNVYPGGISCIVSKGDWLLRLGFKSFFQAVLNKTEK